MVTSISIATLCLCVFAGTEIYYNGILEDRNSKIASLNNKIANLNSKIASLKGQLANLTGIITHLKSANLVADVGTFDFPPYLGYNSVYIGGQVTNRGEGTAYNAGIHIVAYSDGVLETNMTVPLASSATYYSTNSQSGQLQLSILDGGQSVQIGIILYYQGLVSGWTLTPVWTNSP